MHPTVRLLLVTAVALAAALPLLACAGARPAQLGLGAAALAACPASPNCVSSEADDDLHRVDPLRLGVAPGEAWQAARAVVAALPRTRVVTQTDSYLHAESRSALLGFVDDLELQLRPGDRVIAVRSASRTGYSDMGVNRRRVEELRAGLAARGVLDAGARR